MMHLTPSFIKTDKFDNLFSDLTCLNLALYIVTTVFIHSTVFPAQHDLIHKAMWASFFIPFLIFGYYFLRGKFTYIECVIYALLILMGVYIRKNTGTGEQILFIIYTIICRFVDGDKFLKTGFWTLLISLAIVFLVSFITKNPGANATQIRYGKTRIRYGLGFGYTTLSANYFLHAVILAPFVIKKWNAIHYIVFAAIATILFIFTDTKSAFACTLLMLLLIFIRNKCPDGIIMKLISKLNIVLYFFATISIWLLGAFYNPNSKFFTFIDKLTTGRIYLTNNGFNIWGVTLFGGSANPNFRWGYVDSSFMQILFRNGLVILILVVLTFTILSYIAYKTDDKDLIIVLFILVVHSTFDPQLIMLAYDPLAALGLYYVMRNLDKLPIPRKSK